MATASAPTTSLKQLASRLAEKSKDMSKKEVNELLDTFFKYIVADLKKGCRVRVPGFGILQVRKSAARMARNPATGEAISVPAKKKIRFRPSKELKEAVGK